MLEEIKKLLETKNSLFFRDIQQAHLDSIIQETDEYAFVKKKAGKSKLPFHQEAIFNVTSSLLDNSPLISSHGWEFSSYLPDTDDFAYNAREWDEKDQLLIIKWFLKFNNFKFDEELTVLSNDKEKVDSERLLDVVGKMMQLELHIQELEILSKLKASPLKDWMQLYGVEVPIKDDYEDGLGGVNDFIEILNNTLETNYDLL
jgi:hypothetical protein